MHIQILNPNAQTDIAPRLADLVRARCEGDATVAWQTLEHAPAYLDHPGALAALVPDMRRALQCAVPRPDLALVACFSDARRELAEGSAPFPVFTIADYSIIALGLRGQPFSIVTGGTAWVGPIRDHVHALGFADLLSSVRASPGNALQIMRPGSDARRAFDALLDACVAEDGAAGVLLAGGGFIGAGPVFRMQRSTDGLFDCGELAAEVAGRIVAGRLDCTSPAALIDGLRP